MAYLGSEALRYDQFLGTAQEQEQGRSFEVLDGRGLDAQVRAGVTPLILSVAKAAFLAATLVVALGVARVTLSVATVNTMQDNRAVETQIDEAAAYCDELQIERSILASATRINTIATQNLGMVFYENPEHIVMPTGESESAQLEHQFTQASDASSADAAQSASEAEGVPQES